MTERSSLDDLAEASRQMATRLAGIEAHLRGHGYTLINTDILNAWRFSEPNIPAAHQKNPEDVLETVAQARYEWPDMESRLINAVRVRQARQQLISQGSYSVKQIAEALDQQVNTVHKRLQRASDRAELFVVVAEAQRLVPAVLLDEALDTRLEWHPVIKALRASNMSEWAMWGWIAEPNAGLSGDIAAEVITADPERVYAAAQRRLVQATS